MEHPITEDLQRTLYHQTHPKATTTLIFIGGIHGNEPAGIYGLQQVIA
jgi:succinylglutamate desuccinylase